MKARSEYKSFGSSRMRADDPLSAILCAVGDRYKGVL